MEPITSRRRQFDSSQLAAPTTPRLEMSRNLDTACETFDSRVLASGFDVEKRETNSGAILANLSDSPGV